MPVNIHGRSYATVAERLDVAHGENNQPVGIASIVTHLHQLGQWEIIESIVTFADGRVFSGMAELARGEGRGPQATSPVETAQTSAVGRALAMAGYKGSDAGFAGAEEMQIAESRGGVQSRRPSYVSPSSRRV
jgi:hypothetical protein